MISPEEERLLASLQGVIRGVASGSSLELEDFSERGGDSSLQGLAEDTLRLGKLYAESYAFLLQLARGNLAAEAPPRNSFAAPYKALQAELRHLTWQIQEIAQGHLEHQVSFSGDFSAAINAMIEALRDKERLGEQNTAYAQLFKTIFETSADGMLIADLDGRVQHLSRAGRAMFQVEGAELAEGVNLFEHVCPEDRERALFLVRKLREGHPTGFAEYRVMRRDGTIFWNESNAAVLLDGQGEPKGLFIIFRDITQRKADEAKLKGYSDQLEALNVRLAELATTDALTGVHNRRSFDQRLEQELQRALRFGQGFCLIMFDIDHFKNFNDRFGHAVGDLVLVSVCGSVGLHIRQVDGLYRFGGEEFMIVLTEATLAQGLLVAENLRALVEHLNLSHQEAALPTITASFGVCCTSELKPLNSALLLEAVDKALYEAKASGRNCVRAAGL